MAILEKTLVFLKPDAYCRKYIGAKILQEFLNNKDFEIIGFKEVEVSEQHAKEHYSELEGKSFYPGLLKFITSAKVLAMIIRGERVIQKVRDFLGATLVEKADENCIRGKYGIYAGINLVHASDSPDTAKRELELWKKYVNLIPTESARIDVETYIEKWIKNEINETLNLRKLCIELESNPKNKDIIELKLIETLKKECTNIEERKIKDLCSCVIENILSQD
ncbi:MAG: nucleoside-diphosphate kinase [Candidatus Lokiarchaeota archaeon]|nr:nucleoside-diphosphate kinase [Candidatus Lokiarchaeota archaeon]